MKITSILVVDDDRPTRMLVEARLRAAGHRVESVATGEQALERLAAGDIDVLVVDMHLPQMSGLAVIEIAKAHDPDLEVIVMTASTMLDLAIRSLRCGVFGYMIKPGEIGELEATVRDALARRHERLERSHLLRRLGSELLRISDSPSARYLFDSSDPPPQAADDPTIQLGRLRIDTRRHTVTRDRQPIPLSSSEFALLLFLAEHRDQVLSAQQIVRAVLGYSCSAAEARELLKVRIYKLRQKLEVNPAAPQILISVRGAGYMLTAGAL